MLSAIRRHLSPAMVLALVALVFAVTGGAFAATGGSGSGAPAGAGGAKATASVAGHSIAVVAKGKGGKGPRGPRGLAGPAGREGKQGPAGATGAKGETGSAGPQGPQGAAGANGTDGVNGKSVVTVPFEGAHEPAGAQCKGAGGYIVEVEDSSKQAYVCNGSGGSGGGGGSGGEGYPKALPKGKSETGVWTSANREENKATEGYENISISFPVQLEGFVSNGHALFVDTEEQTNKTGNYVHCGGSTAEPQAEEGFLCVYQGFTEVEEGFTEYQIGSIAPVTGGVTNGAGVSGAVMVLVYKGPEDPHEMQGSWAVTAE
jgi:hypothetical protein